MNSASFAFLHKALKDISNANAVNAQNYIIPICDKEVDVLTLGQIIVVIYIHLALHPHFVCCRILNIITIAHLADDQSVLSL